MTSTAVSVPMPAVPRTAPFAGRSRWRRLPSPAPRRSCWPPRAATAPAWTGPSSPWRRRWSTTVRRSTCASRSCTTSTWSARWRTKGAIFVDETDEVPEGALVIFSAHGVSPAVVQSAADRGLRTIDATCPLVTKVHREAVRFAKDDFDILLIGHDGHEEVEGTSGEAPEHIQIINGPARGGQGHGPRPGEGHLALPDHPQRGRDHGDRPAAQGAVPHPAGSAQRRHLLRHHQPPGGHQEDRPAGGPGHRGGFRQLLQLRPAGGGGAGVRRQGLLPGGLRQRGGRGLV